MRPGESRRLRVAGYTMEIRELASFCRESVDSLFCGMEASLIELAVVEAANNVVKHAYELEGGLPLDLTIRHCGDSLELTLLDKGLPFDIGSLEPPSFEWDRLEDVPESGWGVYLIQSIMDSVDYRHEGGTNIVRMVKRLPKETAVAPLPDIALVRPAGFDSELEKRLIESEAALDEMVEELSSAYESLNIFYSLSRNVSPVSNVNVFLANTLEKMLSCVGDAAWGTIRFKDGKVLTLKASAGECPGEALVSETFINGDSPEAQASSTLRRVFRDNYEGRPFRVMCVPVVGLDEFIGTVLVGKPPGEDLFSAGDAKLARAMADQIAVSVEHNRLYSKAIDAEIAERELAIATKLQKKLIQKKLPDMPGLRFHMVSATAKQVGGDYSTVMKMDDNSVYVFISDAMGKGMSASNFALLSHMAVHSVVLQQHNGGISPGGILSLINEIMADDFDLFGMFMTALMVKINPGKGLLSYASAGHCPPIMAVPDGTLEVLDTSDFMLGVERGTKYADFERNMPQGGKLLLYSDGLTDVMDQETGEPLGLDFLLEVCQNKLRSEGSVAEACDAVFNAILRRTGEHIQDDISIVGVERVHD